MSEGTAVFSNISGVDPLPARLQDMTPSPLPCPEQTNESALSNSSVCLSPTHPPSSPGNGSQGYGSDSPKGDNSSVKSPGSSPGRHLTPKSILSCKHISNRFSPSINSKCIQAPHVHSHVTDEDLDSSKSKPPSAPKQLKKRPSQYPAIKTENSFCQTVFRVPSPVPSKIISWGSDDNLGGVRYQNSGSASPARLSIVSSGDLPLDQSPGDLGSAGCSKSSLTNLMPLQLTADKRSVTSSSKPKGMSLDTPATPSRDNAIAGILKTPTRSRNGSPNGLTSSAGLISPVNNGSSVKSTDFSSNRSLKLFATTLSGADMFNNQGRVSSESCLEDKASTMLLNGVNKFHSSSQELSDNRSVTFQADQMSQVFNRFKVLFESGDSTTPDKLDNRDVQRLVDTQPSDKASSGFV
ncbi:hypothetical protein EGW08_003099 [Elysia chlorotica]|uniref:Uncharacterized protein n=1 Tax=Elysia chlorotica TaxID=188477 RepID=A0A433U5N9_ELYCH|nr:hypothetical protein EGW08_003099 [Elysia chlorotica]